MSKITEEIMAKATEHYTGNDLCMAQTRRLLQEVCLPNGLLPLKDVEECGYIETGESRGFVWLKQKKEIEHKFKGIDKWVRYGTEVTAEVEPCRIYKLTGVKAKEFMFWLDINEITVKSPDSDKISFKNGPTGISKVFPTSAFVVEGAGEVGVKVVRKVAKAVVAATDEGEEVKVNKEVDEAAIAISGLDLKEKKVLEEAVAAPVGVVEVQEV